MIQVPYEDIVAIISEKSGLEKAQIETKVKEKTDMLSGLVSKEGAAHIVANELGINLQQSASGKMKIAKIAPGMRDLVVVGRAVQLYEPRPFESQGRQGQVGAVILGDETGTLRLTFWNEQADMLQKIKQNDILRVEGGLAKEGMRGVEVHVNSRTTVQINPPGETVEAVQQAPERAPAQRKKLSEITESDTFVEVMGTLVQAFEPRFYEVCPQCQKRARTHNNTFVCDNHGEIEPGFAYVMNIMIDDGTENLRVACFREQVQQVLRKTNDEIVAMRENPALFEPLKTELLGNFYKITGRVNKNDMFDRLEIVASRIDVAKPEEEIAQLGK